jgi:hypothetical protein
MTDINLVIRVIPDFMESQKLPEELGTMEKEVGAPIDYKTISRIDTNYANTIDGRKRCGNPP